MRSLIESKKGNIGIIILFAVLLVVTLFIGFIMVVGSSIINWTFDIAAPELTDLGVIGDTNMTDVASYTITPLNTLVQSTTWLTGVLYMMMLVGSIGIAVVFRTSPNKWLIGFYLGISLLVIITAMFISNVYEDFYDDTDDLGTRLKEHTLLSYMILYSPAIFSIIVFITGIILFSGIQEDQYL